MAVAEDSKGIYWIAGIPFITQDSPAYSCDPNFVKCKLRSREDSEECFCSEGICGLARASEIPFHRAGA